MARLLVALLVAIAEPVAPVAPKVPVVEMPALTASATPTSAPAAAATSSPERAAAPALATSTSKSAPALAPLPAPAGKPSARSSGRGASPERLLDLTAPPRPDSGEQVSTPPNLTGAALREELRAAAQRRQAELAAIGRARAGLEKLVADIAAARGALGKETARLDELVKKATADKLIADKAVVVAAPRKATPDDDKRALAMAKTLKSMKPDQAATLLARRDRPLAVSMLRRMRPGDAGAVLEKMKPETAAELFSIMASSEASGGTK